MNLFLLTQSQISIIEKSDLKICEFKNPPLSKKLLIACKVIKVHYDDKTNYLDNIYKLKIFSVRDFDNLF